MQRRWRVTIGLMISMLAGAAWAEIPPPPPPLDFPPPVVLPAGKDFPITDFGAVGDGKTINTAAIQKAIDACSQAAGTAGSGTLVVPRGTFVSGAIFLKQGVNLRIEKDGVLKGSVNPADYPIIDTRFEGIERPFMAAFVNVIGANGLTVSGQGTIDGSGDQWLAQNGRGALGRGRGAPAAPASPPGTLPANRVPPVQTVFTAPRSVLTPTPQNPPALTLVGAGSNRPRLICFTNCTDCVIRDLHLQNQAVWCLHTLYCTDFLADHLDIKDPSRRVPSSDGIDIDSSRRVRVNAATIDVNDDCISIKSGKDADGRRVNRPCQDILIVNSHMAYGHGGVAMGSEVSGMIRNVEVRDTLMDSDNWAPIRFKSQPTRGGTVENIVYRNITLDHVRQAFEFNLEWNVGRTPGSGQRMPTIVKNVYLINITGNVDGTGGSAGIIHGLPDGMISNVMFRDCDIRANTGLRFDNARDLDTSGLKIQVQQGQPIVFRNAPPATTRP